MDIDLLNPLWAPLRDLEGAANRALHYATAAKNQAEEKAIKAADLSQTDYCRGIDRGLEIAHNAGSEYLRDVWKAIVRARQRLYEIAEEEEKKRLLRNEAR